VRRPAAILLLVIAASSGAHAEPPPFASLDRTAGQTGGGAELAFQSLDDSNFDGGHLDNGHAGRMDLFSEYALTDVFGVTASLPLVWTDVGYDDIWGIGAIHLGGYGRFRFADRHELLLRAGAQLPSESYPTDGTYWDWEVLHATAFQRLEDPMLSSGAVWLRGGASYRLRLGDVAAQVDYLVDLPVGGDLEPLGAPDGFWARVVFAGGVAYAPGRWAVAGELVAAGFPYVEQIEDQCFGPDVYQATFCEQVSTEATVSARVKAEPFVLSLWFSQALDEKLRDHEVHVFGFGARSSF
jgi:hypothetical protein